MARHAESRANTENAKKREKLAPKMNEISEQEMYKKYYQIEDVGIQYHYFDGKIDPDPTFDGDFCSQLSQISDTCEYHDKILVSPHMRTLSTALGISQNIFIKTGKKFTYVLVPLAKESLCGPSGWGRPVDEIKDEMKLWWIYDSGIKCLDFSLLERVPNCPNN